MKLLIRPDRLRKVASFWRFIKKPSAPNIFRNLGKHSRTASGASISLKQPTVGLAVMPEVRRFRRI